MGDKRVVLVPGNHDHPLLPDRAPARSSSARSSARERGPLGQIASWLPQTELVLSYPGYRIRDDVYAIHGHYLDCHNTVPTIENILVALAKRRSKAAESGPLDGERITRTPWRRSTRSASRSRSGRARPRARRPSAPGRCSRGRTGSAAWRARILGDALVPGGVAALNRLGFGPFNPEISGPALRHAGLRAMGQVWSGWGSRRST